MNLHETKKVDYKDLYQADERWQMGGIKTKEEYAEKLILPVNFHVLVPEDIKAAYETAQYLMAHAWHHWPMYDEAFNKVTRIFEIAVKQKAKQLNIPIITIDKNGKEKQIALSQIIDKICKVEIDKRLEESLKRSRTLRNILAHPKQNNFMGPMGYTHLGIMSIINDINLLFMDYALFEKTPKQIEAVEKFKKRVDEGVFSLQHDNKKYLVHEILHFELYPHANGFFLYLSLNLVTKNTFESISKGADPEPFTLAVELGKIDETILTGTDILSGEEIIMKSSDNSEDQRNYQVYLADLKKVQETESDNRPFPIGHEVFVQIEKMKYETLWSKY